MSQPVALVTGGSSGIGLAVARRLAEDGFRVVVTGRRKDALEKAAALHDNIEAVQGDIANGAEAKAAVDAVRDRHGRLDVLVNNAGIAPPAPLAQTDDAHVDAILGTNIRGVVTTTREALPLLREAKGQVINISSALAQRPLPGLSVYGASKAALSSLTKAWARELAPDGIRVNAVNPGPIATPIYDQMGLPPEEAEAMAKQIAGMVPLGRFGEAEEVADVVSYLASSPRSAFVNASEILVDGGFGS